jgi:phosphoenolpyruvate carboxykinase (ATP)
MIDLCPHGLNTVGTLHHKLVAAQYVERAVQRREGMLAENGALVAYTGAHTGRAAKDKYIVATPAAQAHVLFGPAHQAMSSEVFSRLLDTAQRHLETRPELYVFDGQACADARYAVKVRVIAEKAWHAFFADLLLRRPDPSRDFKPELVIYHAPDLRLDPKEFGTRSETVVALNFDEGKIVVAGTQYAGEIKKGVFTYLNYWMPQRRVFPMHCSANVGAAGDTALLFGLSGTGKTTLSADPSRRLIGDDEHGWSEHGVFNFEGGCYAKCIRLSEQGEPQIWQAIRFGSILENVVLDPATRRADYDADHYTENTRAAYPLEYIPGIEPSSQGPHPRTILFLTCDSYGVLPPISRLTTEQAMYHFLSGYTSKIAGTEQGVKDPGPTFSACFGAPFLPLPPVRYAEMLRDRLLRHGAAVWLVNTGWTGGPYGVGRRMPLPLTRRMVQAALAGELDAVSTTPDPVFKILVPSACPDVPASILTPRLSWSNPEAFEHAARTLAQQFRDNFAAHHASASEEVRRAGP